MSFRAAAMCFGLAVAVAQPVAAQAVDPGDIAFWQSIQSSQNPAEFEAYLQTFPTGVFAELARLRIQTLGGAAPAAAAAAPALAAAVADPAPAPATVAAAPAARDVVGDATITIDPTAPRVGQEIYVTITDWPNGGAYDQIILVPAGTPDVLPVGSNAVLAYTYMGGTDTYRMRSLPPGQYEARWMTGLYNLEGRMEVGARHAFTVSR